MNILHVQLLMEQLRAALKHHIRIFIIIRMIACFKLKRSFRHELLEEVLQWLY